MSEQDWEQVRQAAGAQGAGNAWTRSLARVVLRQQKDLLELRSRGGVEVPIKSAPAELDVQAFDAVLQPLLESVEAAAAEASANAERLAAIEHALGLDVEVDVEEPEAEPAAEKGRRR